MRKRLSFLVVFFITVTVASMVLVSLNEAKSISRQISMGYLTSTADYISSAYAAGDDREAILKEVEANYDRLQIPMRVTLLDLNGKVLFDNQQAPDQADNHLGRSEIQTVIKTGQPGQAVRFSKSLNRELLYYARKISGPQGPLICRVSVPLAIEKKMTLPFQRKTFLVVLFASSLAIVFVAYFSKKVSRPIADLVQAADSLCRGDLSARVSYSATAYEEMQLLGKTFNGMANTLQIQHDELAESKAWLQVVINSLTDALLVIDDQLEVVFANQAGLKAFHFELYPGLSQPSLEKLLTSDSLVQLAARVFKDKTEQAVQAKIQIGGEQRVYSVMFSPINEHYQAILFHDMSSAYQAQQMRAEFVANVTHELKTPLTSIRGFIETMRDAVSLSPTEREKFLAIMDVEAERLERLINDMLSLSAIENADDHPQRQNFNLAELIDEVAVQLDDYAANRQVFLRVSDQLPENLPVSADRDKIKQLLLNLVDNAIKYNRPRGWVSIRARRYPDRPAGLELVVEDSGVGIGATDQSRIFERFYRVDKSRSKELGGTGLGLSIVKHIALMYDGDAQVESQLGKGSKFTVNLAI